jgi:SulP family sulfate permease
VAIDVGVILATLLFMRRMSDAVRIEPHTGGTSSELKAIVSPGVTGVLIYSIEGPFFFGAAVLFTEVRPNVFYKLERGGLIDLIGRENVFESLNDALARAEQGLPHAARDGTVSDEI